MTRILYILGFLIWCIPTGFSQIQVINGATAPYNEQNLIENVFLGDGVEVMNITHSGVDRAIGYFSNGMADINLDRGIIMSTGLVEDAMEPNQTPFPASGFTSGFSVSDPQLESIATVALEDQNVYEISFIPISDTLRFRYIFASEEYPEFVCNEYNDVFGFFINGPRPVTLGGGNYDWLNIAKVPDPSDPTGMTFLDVPVSINTVNNGILPGSGDLSNGCDLSFGQYFNQVDNGELPVYNGYLDVFVAEAIVIPCQEYTIKLAIGDGGDNIYDSAVFLEAKSFGTASLSLEVQTESLDGGVAEGCNPASINFTVPTAVSANLDLDFNIITSGLSVAVAENGVDYELLSDDLEILSGESSVGFELVVLEDNQIEGEEFFVFDYQRNICNRDTIYIRLVENQLEMPVLPDDRSICRGESSILDTEFPPSFMIPDPPTYRNTTELVIDQDNTPFYSDITVSGMVPEFLNKNVIKQICIDTLIHITPYDLDLYLLTPGGQILELSTDNGWRGPEPDLIGLNFMQVDTFINTCFSVDATRNINNGDPVKGDIFSDTETYTGSFLPEGVWMDLWDGNYPTNGTYRLLIIDDDPGFNTGILKSWSICFSSVYEINYEWSADPAGSLSCLNCEDPVASPTENTTYYLSVKDSYGCTEVDSISITILETPEVLSNLICNETDIGQLTFSWDADVDANFYEVSIDGGLTWDNIGLDLFYIVDGLSMSEIVDFWVRGSNISCPGEITSLLCSPGNCAIPNIILSDLNEVSCAGGNDGDFTIIASGSTGPYSYNLDGEINNTGIFTGLSEGEYTIVITDDFDCQEDFMVVVNEPEPINGDFIVVDQLKCHGDNDGSLTMMFTTGDGPFDFSWSDGQSDSIALNLASDVYTVTVTDNNNCQKEFTTTLDQPEPLNITQVLGHNVSCFGIQDGIGVVSISGGVLPYTYLWEDGSVTDSLANIGVGNYSVTITDNLFCSEIAEINITEPDVLSAQLDFSHLSCFDSVDGMISVNPIGGTEPYSFVWSSGQVTSQINNLEASNYTVTITDANMCSIELEQEIIAPSEISIGFNVGQIECYGSATGAIAINVSGGDSNYSYQWQGVNTVQVFTSQNINGLVADEYCVTVTDGDNCASSLCATLSDPDQIIVTEVISNASCAGGTDGAVDIDIQGGNPPYVVVWVGETSPNNEDLIDVGAGTYNLQITDSDNCSFTASYEVLQATSMTISESVVDVQCKDGESGSITLTVEGGVAPYLISWNGPGNFIGSGPVILNLDNGTYNVTVLDQNNCSFISSYSVEEPVEFLSSSVEDAYVCGGDNNGTLKVVAEGGTAPYIYEWDTGALIDSISNLSEGIYSVTITDAQNCTHINSANIISFPELEIVSSSDDASCFELNNGVASIDTILVDGEILALSQFNFAWNTSPFQNGSQAFNLEGDQSYTVTISDENGCSSTVDIFIGRPDPLEIELLQLKDPICYNGNDGFIEVSGLGGTAPYSFVWSINTGTQMDSLAQQLRAGSYSVTITDSMNCTVSASYNLFEPSEIVRDFISTDVSCFGFNDGTVELMLAGGGPPYEMIWSTGDTGNFIEGLSSAWYYVTITDTNMCTLVDSVFIPQSVQPISFSYDTEDVSCYGGFDGSISIFPEGGNGIYQYSLDGINYTGSSVLIGLEAGIYNIYVKDQNGCESIVRDVEIDQYPEIVIDIGTIKEVPYGEDLQLFPEVLNGIGDLSFLWTSASIDLFNCDNCSFPIITNITENIFTTLTVTDENGCAAEIRISIITILDNFIDVPTGFTPGSDGINDLLHVYGKSGMMVKEFSIYDRWGEKIYSANDFETNDTTIGWDGSFKGEPLNPGVFIWTAEVESVDGNVRFYKGSTTLIR